MQLERLEVRPLPLLISDIISEERTGVLRLRTSKATRSLYWSEGELILFTSTIPEESVIQYVSERKAIDPAASASLFDDDPTQHVVRVTESRLIAAGIRDALLREWLTARVTALFSLEEGTATFSDEEALDPERRVFLRSMPALVVDGCRRIESGLLIRRCLGDLSRTVVIDGDDGTPLDQIPLTVAETKLISGLAEPVTIQQFLRSAGPDSLASARVLIALMTLGSVTEPRERRSAHYDQGSMQKDLEILSTLDPGDTRSMRALAIERQLDSMTHYDVLDISPGTLASQIRGQSDAMLRQFRVEEYPQPVRSAVDRIRQRIEEATTALSDAKTRGEYDSLLADAQKAGDMPIQQFVAQRRIVTQNVKRADELILKGDYYGAIILLRQAIRYAPDNADAWYLFALAQEKNPRWRRKAVECYLKAISIRPDFVDARIALGDLYQSEGLSSRAENCYRDVLEFDPINERAQKRLAKLKK